MLAAGPVPSGVLRRVGSFHPPQASHWAARPGPCSTPFLLLVSSHRLPSVHRLVNILFASALRLVASVTHYALREPDFAPVLPALQGRMMGLVSHRFPSPVCGNNGLATDTRVGVPARAGFRSRRVAFGC